MMDWEGRWDGDGDWEGDGEMRKMKELNKGFEEEEKEEDWC